MYNEYIYSDLCNGLSAIGCCLISGYNQPKPLSTIVQPLLFTPLKGIHVLVTGQQARVKNGDDGFVLRSHGRFYHMKMKT